MSDEDDYRIEVLISLRRLERLDKDEYSDDERQEAEEVRLAINFRISSYQSVSVRISSYHGVSTDLLTFSLVNSDYRRNPNKIGCLDGERSLSRHVFLTPYKISLL